MVAAYTGIMKPFAVAVAIALAEVLAPSASFGDAPAAIAGSVIAATTGRPLAGVTVEVSGQHDPESRTAITDKHGFFVFLGLDPDRYVATARLGEAASCRIEDVASGQMRRMQIALGTIAETTCAAGRSSGSLFDPDESANVYRIHQP